MSSKSILIFKEYQDHIKINNKLYRESNSHYRPSSLVTFNLNPGFYDLSHSPNHIFSGDAYCFSNIKDDILYNKNKNYHIFGQVINFSEPKILHVTLKYPILSFINKPNNPPRFIFTIDQQKLVFEETPFISEYIHIYINKGFHKISLYLKNKKNATWCACPTSFNGNGPTQQICWWTQDVESSSLVKDTIMHNYDLSLDIYNQRELDIKPYNYLNLDLK